MGDNRRSWVSGLPVLAGIWLLGAVFDRLWFAIDQQIPAWDQAEYLAGALNYWQALQTPQWFSSTWWTELWLISSKVPPLVYIATAPFLSLFGTGPDQSTLVALLFSAILLGSVYTLGCYLFTAWVGLWAAGLCLLLPGLYRVRLDFLLDYPLAAMVTLSFTCLTLWRGKTKNLEASDWKAIRTGNQTLNLSLPSWRSWFGHGYQKPTDTSETRWNISIPTEGLCQWLLTVAIGLTLGLALMVKQTALFFLLVPLLWAGLEIIRQRAWGRLAQLGIAVALSVVVFGSWYRTNWLLMLTAGKRATVDSAIAEGDPSLLSLNAWTFYFKELPGMVTLPLLLAALVGFIFFWRQSLVSSVCCGELDYGPKTRTYRTQAYSASKQALGWLLVFWLGGYFLASLNINKDPRYVVPYLPVVSILLAYGLILLPRRWRLLRWGAIGLAGVLMIHNLVPIPLGRTASDSNPYQHLASLQSEFPHADVVDQVVQADPYLRSTIAVLPSTGEINQHNINYYGNLRNFQVYGRQVGVIDKYVEPDSRSFSWFITKTGGQGSIRQQEAQAAIVQAVEQGDDFRLHKAWTLPDKTTLNLFHRRVPALEVTPLVENPQNRSTSSSATSQPESSPTQPDVHLDQILLPKQVPPGKPIPVTYQWSGSLQSLQSGLVLLTWQRNGKSTDRWLHDHTIGMGALYSPTQPANPSRFQVVERTAMLPPTDAATGDYTLEATYLDPQTGKTFAIATPPVRLRINPNAAPTPAPELDLVTQLRVLATALPKGGKALDNLFDEISRINQYDPVQDYVEQARQALEYRLQQEPQNLEFLYALALANVLKRSVNPAIEALTRVTQLDPKNPYAYAYLAFVNLYDFRPQSAQAALKPAFALNSTISDLYLLNAVAAAMQGNVWRAWQDAQMFEKLESQNLNVLHQ